MSTGKRYRSKYDPYFNRTDMSAECCLCKKNIKCSPSSGSNNLKFHLQNAHPEELKKMEDDEASAKRTQEAARNDARLQSTIPFLPVEKKTFKIPQISEKPLSSELTKWDESGSKTKQIKKAILEMIVSDVLPMRFVEKPGFIRLLKILAPKLKMKSRNFYTNNLLPKLESRLKAKIQKELIGISKVSITCDGWTSKDGRHSLLSITGHWIDPSTFQPKFAILGSCAFKGRHTADNMVKILKDGLEVFDIPLGSLACLVRDGAHTMEAFARRLQVQNFHCYSHNLQLCIKDTIMEVDAIASVIEKMKKYVRKVNKSTVARDFFQELQNEQNLPQRMLVKECEVRWSSLFLMVQSFLQSKRAVSILQLDHPELNLPELTSEDWENVQSMYDVLEPIAETTKSVQCRYGAPASVVIPSCRVLEFKLRDMRKKTIDETKNEYIDKLLESILERTAKYQENDYLKTATFLDPRFKDSYFRDSHKRFILKQLRKDCDGVVNESMEDPEVQQFRQVSIFDQFLKETSPEPVVASELDEYEKEIEEYLKTPPCTSINPYEYWKNQMALPNLRKLAVESLSTPATSSESERLFSLSGLICTPKRSNLTPERVDQLTFCTMNISIFGFDDEI